MTTTQILNEYYSEMNDLNKAFINTIEPYKAQYLNFKVAEFKNDLMFNQLNSDSYYNNNQSDPYVVTKKNLDNLNSQYFSLLNDMSKSVEQIEVQMATIQQKIDELKEENKVLTIEANDVTDTSNAAKPYYEQEKILFYRMVVKLIGLIAGSIIILYLLNKTPLKEVSSIELDAGKKAVEQVGQNATKAVEQSDASSVKNTFIAIIVGLVIIIIFMLGLYIVRKLKEKRKEQENQGAVIVTDDCTKCNQESWIRKEFNKLFSNAME